MSSITVKPLQDALNFGARVSGVTRENLQDESIRKQLNQLFHDKGLIIFEGIEPSSKMQVELSNVFGPLKPHPVAVVSRIDDDTMPGVIEMRHDPESEDLGLVEVDGKLLCSWIPWHFDHCYNNELNRAGVLRAVEIAEEGGLTGFADGIELYNNFSPELREKIEGKNVLYTLDMIYDHMRFGQPKNFKEINVREATYTALEQARAMPRSFHPAVWERDSGEKVLHVSPWMSVGIAGQENPEGDKLLQAVCEEIAIKAKSVSYFHQWRPDDMLIWDNWRMLHTVSGHDPKMNRCMHRTTIKGDYGLGGFESNQEGGAVLEMTV